MKQKRKFKHGDYRLTSTGHKIVVGVIAFSVSLTIFVGLWAFGENGVLTWFFFLQSLLSMMGIPVACASGEMNINKYPAWAMILALIFIIPTMIVILVWSAIAVSVERVE